MDYAALEACLADVLFVKDIAHSVIVKYFPERLDLWTVPHDVMCAIESRFCNTCRYTNGDVRRFLFGVYHGPYVNKQFLPAIELNTGGKMWFRYGEPHRDDDQPAFEHSTGSKYWYYRGKKHRFNKPAVIDLNGKEEYWMDGIQIK